MKLSNLCWIYDDNHITIEGNTKLAFNEDVGRRFEGLGWHVLHVADANDLDALRRGLQVFERNRRPADDDHRPQPYRLRLAEQARHAKAHGEALGEEEIRLTKKVYGWPEDAKFLVPDEAREHFQAGIAVRGREAARRVASGLDEIRQEISRSWRRVANDGSAANCRPVGMQDLPTFPADAKGMATPHFFRQGAQGVAKHVPWLIGGAADLAPSTMTHVDVRRLHGDFEPGNYGGRNFHFGIREHGMASAANGMALSNVRPFVATFFVFFDYLKPALRLAAIWQAAGDLRLHARFDRPGRRWTDASADRASGRAAGDPEYAWCSAPPTRTRCSRRGAW